MNSSIRDAVNEIKPNMCNNEYCIQRYLAHRLAARHHVIIDGVEVDVLGNGWAAEIKYNPNFYDGVGQALAYKRILGLRETWLIHVISSSNIDITNHLKRLAALIEGLDLIAAVVHGEGVHFLG